MFRNTSFPNGERWVPSFAHSCEHDHFNSGYSTYPPPSLTASVAAALFNLIRTRSIALRFSEYLQLLLCNIWDQIVFVVGNKVATYCNWDFASSRRSPILCCHKSLPPQWSTIMYGASSKEDIVRSLGLRLRNFIPLYPCHQILFASLSNVKLDPPCLVLACSQAPFIMEDPKIQTDEKPEMIDHLYII